MARSLRPQFEGAVYYITVRGNNRRPLFRDVEDKNRYLQLLRRYRDRFGCRLYAYVLLSNHLHLLIQTPNANVSKFMQGLGTSYASYFNRKYKARGTLFEGRYKSHLVAKNYLSEISSYIHCYCLQKGLKKGWRDYPWSSYRVYLGLENSDLVEASTVLGMFGQAPGEQTRRHWKSMENSSFKNSFLGSEAIPCHIGVLRGSIPPWLCRPGVSQSGGEVSDLRKAEGILRGVSLSLGLDRIEDLKERRRRLLARHLAMYLIRKQTFLPLRSIGALLGVKPAAVALAVGKIEKLLKKGGLPSHIENLLKDLDLFTAVS
ncbi:MAG: transposase [Candidatus Binatia bacterium]